MNTENTSKSKKKSILFISIIAFLSVLLILFLFLFMNTKKGLKRLEREKEIQRLDLKADLDSLLLAHEQVKADYGAIADSLMAKDSMIKENAKEIKKLLNTKWEYIKVKRKLKQLQEISKVYVVQLDSLYTVNKTLKEENEKITKQYQSERRKNTELLKTQEALTKKVTEAAIFKAYSIDIKAIRIRGAKEKNTNKARRTDRLDICFTLGENLVIKPGTHTIYCRIAAPDNHILAHGEGDEYAFAFKGEKLQYSIKQEVAYNNEAMDVCVSWIQLPSDKALEKGSYVVNIFANDQEIGQKSIELN